MVSGSGINSPISIVLFAVGGLGPTLAAMYLLYTSSNSITRQDYWKRVLEVRRISPKWYLILFTIIPSLLGGAIAMSIFFGEPFVSQLVDPQYRTDPLGLIPFMLFALIFGPIPEELGWRGYGLDGLRNQLDGLRASLILGGVHALWHVPLFLIPDYPLRDHLAEPMMMVAYFTMIIAKSFVFTWLFYKTNRSTVSAILLHFMINYTGMISNLSLTTELIQTVVYVALAIVLVIRNHDIFLTERHCR
jgi:membrane protease YdiL (CAAX protease family)